MLLCPGHPPQLVPDLDSGEAPPEASSLAAWFLLQSLQEAETRPMYEKPRWCHKVPAPWGCRPVLSVYCSPQASHHSATLPSLDLPSIPVHWGFQSPQRAKYLLCLHSLTPHPATSRAQSWVLPATSWPLLGFPSPRPAGEPWAWGQSML